MSTSTAMAPRRAGSRRSWPRSSVVVDRRATRDSTAIPQVPCSTGPAPSGRRRGDDRAGPRPPAVPTDRAGRAPVPTTSGAPRSPAAPTVGPGSSPVPRPGSRERRPLGGPTARPSPPTTSPGGTSRSASSARQAATTSKGRPSPSTPPWTLKLATTTPDIERGYRGPGATRRTLMADTGARRPTGMPVQPGLTPTQPSPPCADTPDDGTATSRPSVPPRPDGSGGAKDRRTMNVPGMDYRNRRTGPGRGLRGLATRVSGDPGPATDDERRHRGEPWTPPSRRRRRPSGPTRCCAGRTRAWRRTGTSAPAPSPTHSSGSTGSPTAATTWDVVSSFSLVL